MSRTIGFLTVDRKGRTTLPQEMRDELGIDEQMQLRVERTDDGVYELVPSVVIPRDQLWYHSPEGRERLRSAEDSFRQGRSTSTNGEEETHRFLDSLKGPSLAEKSRSR